MDVSEHTPTNMLQKKVQQMVSHPWFDRTVILLIILNSIVLGLQTNVSLGASYEAYFLFIHKVIWALFVAEVVVKMLAVAPHVHIYFKNGWNIFDFTVVVLSLTTMASGFILVGRLVRLLRILRLITVIPELRLIVSTLMRSLPGMGHIMLLMSVIFYIYAIAGFHLFAEHDPTYWGTLGLSLLALFRIATLEDWTDIMYTAMEVEPYAWVFFVSFVIIVTFIIINLFIAVVINNLEEAKKEHLAQTRPDISQEKLITELHDMQESIVALNNSIQRTKLKKEQPKKEQSKKENPKKEKLKKKKPKKEQPKKE